MASEKIRTVLSKLGAGIGEAITALFTDPKEVEPPVGARDVYPYYVAPAGAAPAVAGIGTGTLIVIALGLWLFMRK